MTIIEGALNDLDVILEHIGKLAGMPIMDMDKKDLEKRRKLIHLGKRFANIALERYIDGFIMEIEEEVRNELSGRDNQAGE